MGKPVSPAGEPGPYARVALGGKVAIVSDEVDRGKSLLTCGDGDFSGTVLHRRPRDPFLVEDEWGAVLGEARSWKAAAAILAAHHGYVLGRFEHNEEWRLDNNSSDNNGSDNNGRSFW